MKPIFILLFLVTISVSKGYSNDSANRIKVIIVGRYNPIGVNEFWFPKSDSTYRFILFHGKFLKRSVHSYDISDSLIFGRDSQIRKIHIYRRHLLIGRMRFFQTIPKCTDQSCKILYFEKTDSFRSKKPYTIRWISETELKILL